MQAKNAEFLTKIDIEELEDYGFVYVRDQPCKIQTFEYVRPNKKFKKRQDEDAPEKVRAEVKAHNVWTDQEVFSGTINEDPCTVPKVEWEEYEVQFVDHKTPLIKLMEVDTEDFEEIDTIPMPDDEKPGFCKLLREEFGKTQEEGDKEFIVKVICMFGRKQIYEYYTKQMDI